MEVKGYRESLEMIREYFPDRISINPDECAKLMGVDRKTVYAAIRKAKNPLPSKRLGSRGYQIPVTRLAEWLCTNTN